MFNLVTAGSASVAVLAASPSSYSLRCSSLQNSLLLAKLAPSRRLQPFCRSADSRRRFHAHVTAACLLILGATKIPPCAMAVTRTRPVTLSIEQQTIPAQKRRKATLWPTKVQPVFRSRLVPSKMNFRHKTIIGLPFLAMPSRAFTGSVLLASKPHVSGSSSRNQAYWSRNASLWTFHSAWGRAAINTLRCLLDCSIGDFSQCGT